MTPPPRYLTSRRPDLPSHGARVGAVSRLLGHPFMAWQRTAAHLLGEHLPGGHRVHPFTVVTIQRQSGKTTWLLAEAVERCLFGRPRTRVWYTAQTGQYAREKWAELVDEVMRAPAFAEPIRDGRISVKRTNGSELLEWPNGSTLRPFPPTRDALHSMVTDLVIVDEAWKFTAARGAELLQAIGPTQATRPGAQVVIVSSAGTDESTFLRPLVDRGRAADPGLAYLEWSIPDDIDPLDIDQVASYHPAVGHTIDRDFLHREALVLADKPGEFARAYGNRWTSTLERVIPVAVWAGAATAAALPDTPVVLAADIALDRTRAAIVAAAGGTVEVIESRDGVDWVADRVVELVARWHPAAVVVDRYGPSGTLADALELADITLEPITTADYAVACARFIDGLGSGAIHYRLHPALDAAASAAARRNIGDGWVWGRRTATAPICELVAATLAAWADQHRPIRRKPVARSGRSIQRQGALDDGSAGST